MRLPQILILILLLLASCKKSEEVTVPNNTAPPDNTINSQTYEDYVTRTYIRVLGREPSATEMSSALSTLYQHSLSKADRQQFLNVVFTKPEYYSHTFNEQWINLLNNADTSDITLYIYLLQIGLDDTTQMASWYYYHFEQDRLFAMHDTITQFYNGTVSVKNLQKTLVNNFLYDQINMNSVNFVISMFLHFFYRNPTQQEQDAAAAMVDGSNSSIFLQTGSSKPDFLNIFFSSTDYYEGQVISAYVKYIYEQPSTIELNDATLKFQNTNDFVQLQKDILVTDKYLFGN